MHVHARFLQNYLRGWGDEQGRPGWCVGSGRKVLGRSRKLEVRGGYERASGGALAVTITGREAGEGGLA